MADNENKKTVYVSPKLTGRSVIYSSAEKITADNVFDEVMNKAYIKHLVNRYQIDYLYKYYKGDQPILYRTKQINKHICNKVVENRAKEIVDFKVGYTVGEPILYIARSEDEAVGESVAKLNSLMVSECKEAKDRELIEWMMICGTAYKMILPDSEDEADEAPYEISIPDPRNTFVIYSNDIDHKPLAGVYYIVDDNGFPTFGVYTKERFFLVGSGKIIKNQPNNLGMIPIIEYPANNARLGAFEPVLGLLDAINIVDSNRLDGIEQFIQSLIVAYNCQFEEGTTADSIKEHGMIVLKSIGENKADIKIISETLSQSDTQTVKDDMYNAVLTICSMPNRNGGSSTSDTGIAVVYRDGWSSAETSAKNTEIAYKTAEMEALKIVLKICNTVKSTGINLKLGDVSIKFLRRNYENIEAKATVLLQMLSSDKIHPKLAFEFCNMFPDVEEAFKMSMEWAEKAKKEQEAQLEKQNALNKEKEPNEPTDE